MVGRGETWCCSTRRLTILSIQRLTGWCDCLWVNVPFPNDFLLRVRRIRLPPIAKGVGLAVRAIQCPSRLHQTFTRFLFVLDLIGFRLRLNRRVCETQEEEDQGRCFFSLSVVFFVYNKTSNDKHNTHAENEIRLEFFVFSFDSNFLSHLWQIYATGVSDNDGVAVFSREREWITRYIKSILQLERMTWKILNSRQLQHEIELLEHQHVVDSLNRRVLIVWIHFDPFFI